MLMTKVIWQFMCQVFMSATNVWAQSDGDQPHFIPIIADFNVETVQSIDDLTLADSVFEDDKIHSWPDEWGQSFDPVTGDFVAELGTNTLSVTFIAGPSSLPVTVYGFAVVSMDDELMAVMKLPAPVVINAQYQGIKCTDTTLRFPKSMVS